MWKNIAKGSSREVGYVNYIKAKADSSQSNELSKGTERWLHGVQFNINLLIYVAEL